MRLAAAAWSLVIALPSATLAVTGAITYGQTRTGTLGASQQDIYTFTAPADGRVLVRVVSTAGVQAVGVELFRPTTGTVGSAGGVGPVATIDQASVVGGAIYEVCVPPVPTGAGYAGQSYRVFLQSTTAPVGATPLDLGASAAGSIDQPGEMDFFTIAATAGDELLFTVDRTSGAVDPSAVVYFPGATCTPSYGALDGADNPTVLTQCLFSATATYAGAIEDVDDAATPAVDGVETGGWDLGVSCVSGGCLAASTTTTIDGGTTTTTTLAPPVEQLAPGSKLLLKDKAGKPQKRALKVKLAGDGLTLGDGNGSGDDPRTAGGTLRVRSATGGFDTTYALPAERWKLVGADGANEGYRYVDRRRADGPVGVLVVKPGRIRIAGKGADLDVSLVTDPTPIDVVVTIGGARYCARFGGTVMPKGATKLVARDAEAPPACP